MRIQPRQQLLDIWRATASASYAREKDEWIWGGREAANSIADSEQLLCIMVPATEIPTFRLDQPNHADEEVLAAIRHLGDALDVPRLLVRILVEYLEKYSDADGTPVFPGGSYFSSEDPRTPPTAEQLALDVVEGYASSIQLALSALGFARVFRRELTRPDLLKEIDKLEMLADRRLSAAMVGLLRSFAVSVFELDHPYGVALLRTVNQGKAPTRTVIDELQEALRPTRAGLRDLSMGMRDVTDLDSANRLFECGWTWGVPKNAPVIERAGDAGHQREGYALDSPYLYFTVVALDGIADLYSDRTRLLGLLDDDQLRLASALRLRWDLTQRYWSTIASFGTRRWPLEDIPWRTVDELESDYFSLLVTSIAARDLALRRNTDADLSRLGQILIELANRSRITRRPFTDDVAVGLHDPGVAVKLEGTESLGPQLHWVATDFASLLLKRSLSVASLINNIGLRGQLLELADDIWDHLAQRRIGVGRGARLWDQPGGVFDTVSREFDEPSWHHTVRVVESLVIAANLTRTPPLASDRLTFFVRDLLAEAEHLFDQELLAGSQEGGRAIRERIQAVGQRLRRSREIMDERPASAAALLVSVLRDLDDLAAARPDKQGAS
jgi:hypothetical protein